MGETAKRKKVLLRASVSPVSYTNKLTPVKPPLNDFESFLAVDV